MVEEIPHDAGALSQLVREHRDEILKIAQKHGAFNVQMFGSVARGEETLESDIDILVDFKAPYTLWQWIRLQNELQQLLQHRVDVSVRSQLHPDIRPWVMKNAVSL